MAARTPVVGTSTRVINAAFLILDRMAISLTDLLQADAPRAAAPTFAVYMPNVSDAVTDGSRHLLERHLRRVL
ncbi:hypothetical protein FKR81_23245 [Lentzea tibetensis]|uniref:Uncharacterized protein n=1 Tax=Lentzea tibetensis TaxID=2591470 RepID=A0A563EQA2_9PSEU|nr:hypothetical protein [Lentzea tibetensis]TWP49469.1 hypothetical protein FKR81_23245 [Lentzea tibetensis]